MAFWKKLFGKNKEPKEEQKQLNWIEADQNPWKIRLVDFRPISQHMLSTSKDPRMAENAVSYNQEDGSVFLSQKLDSESSFETDLRFSIDHKLEEGVLFTPTTMEHKWAIFFHSNLILFVRSWHRKVFVKAETIQEGSELVVNKVYGKFLGEETNEHTESVLRFLVHSHVLQEVIPAPIPTEMKIDTYAAGLHSFSAFGNMAHYGYFGTGLDYPTKSKLRSNSLLHIAVAKGEMLDIKRELEKGTNLNAIANDGHSTLQWSIVSNLEVLEYLFEKGIDPNVKSIEGTTAIMTAVESDKIDHLKTLIKFGADVNVQDDRGFTALHRAAEMGHLEIVKILLNEGGNKNIEAEGHTPLSLAKTRKNKEIIKLFEG